MWDLSLSSKHPRVQLKSCVTSLLELKKHTLYTLIHNNSITLCLVEKFVLVPPKELRPARTKNIREFSGVSDYCYIREFVGKVKTLNSVLCVNVCLNPSWSVIAGPIIALRLYGTVVATWRIWPVYKTSRGCRETSSLMNSPICLQNFVWKLRWAYFHERVKPNSGAWHLYISEG